MVLPQHQHARQYLIDAIRVGRHPALIVLRASAEPLNDPSRTLLHWLRDQGGELGAIPVLMLSGVRATVLDTPFTIVAEECHREQISAGIVRALRQDARNIAAARRADACETVPTFTRTANRISVHRL
jgi:hypothetical protein